MKYLVYHFKVNPIQPASDILLAQLSELEFESFEEHSNGLTAYVQEDKAPENIDHIQILQHSDFDISWQIETVEQKNWNKEWEKNFHPIAIDNSIYIRAPFHSPKEGFTHNVIIEPKMSFGTGHHETTHQMIQLIVEEDCENKSVLDMGCGTGVLGIVASLNKAKEVDYIDIDDWCVENTKENLERNNCKGSVIKGGANSIQKKYQLILANINRNVLLEDIPIYAQHLINNGDTLLLSGFYKSDLNLIKEACQNNGLQYVKHYSKRDWVACKFVKS